MRCAPPVGGYRRALGGEQSPGAAQQGRCHAVIALIPLI
jgi:hypothetical protein